VEQAFSPAKPPPRRLGPIAPFARFRRGSPGPVQARPSFSVICHRPGGTAQVAPALAGEAILQCKPYICEPADLCRRSPCSPPPPRSRQIPFSITRNSEKFNSEKFPPPFQPPTANPSTSHPVPMLQGKRPRGAGLEACRVRCQADISSPAHTPVGLDL
jgi:hypothetical protein